MSFFRHLFRAAPVATPPTPIAPASVADPAPVVDPAPVDDPLSSFEDIIEQCEKHEDARILKRSPYQFFTVEEEAPSEDVYVANHEEDDGRWKATASVDPDKYILHTLTAHGKTEEDALESVKKIIVFVHKSLRRPAINDVEYYARVNVRVQTDKNFDSFGMTRNIVNAIMNIPGMESDIIADPISGIRQVTWTTTNLRKFETGLYAYPDTKNMQNTQHVTSMHAFIAKLEQMGRGTVTCIFV